MYRRVISETSRAFLIVLVGGDRVQFVPAPASHSRVTVLARVVRPFDFPFDCAQGCAS